jgi:hypothetical protein
MIELVARLTTVVAFGYGDWNNAIISLFPMRRTRRTRRCAPTAIARITVIRVGLLRLFNNSFMTPKDTSCT